jgi:hypothetical protein
LCERDALRARLVAEPLDLGAEAPAPTHQPARDRGMHALIFIARNTAVAPAEAYLLAHTAGG